jgi:ABC-2 type transport system permease protein
MTSRISCFNRAIFRSALRRTAPLWILYLVFWTAALPVQLLVSRGLDSPTAALQLIIVNAAGTGCGIVSFVYGLAVAWLLFFWLFRTRSAYFYASLPLRRETVFITQYFTGLLIGLLPNLIIFLLAMAAAGSLGLPQPGACLQWLEAVSLGYLFFYSFAVLTCMVIGHAAAMPLFYLMFNCLVFVLDSVVHALLEAFVYGMPESNSALAARFSPLVWFLQNSGQARTITVYNTATAVYDTVGYSFQGWPYLLILGGIGLLCAAAAFFLCRSREMELCGEVVAVRALQPVFLYLFAIGCAFVLGYVILILLGSSGPAADYSLMLVCLLAGAFLGYFAARMMLQKTLRVFSDGWWGYFACCAVILLVFGAARLDVFNYARRIPAPEEVASVRVMAYQDESFASVTDADAISGTIALHRYLLDHQDLAESELRRLDPSSGYAQTIYLEYTLKNGSRFLRKYDAAVTEQTQDDPDSLIGRFEALYNRVPVVLSRSEPDWELTERSFSSCSVSGSTSSSSTAYDSAELGSREAYQLYTDCVLPDIRDGMLGKTDFFVTDQKAESDPYVYLSFNVSDAFGKTLGYSFTVTPEASRTLAYLAGLGFHPYSES